MTAMTQDILIGFANIFLVALGFYIMLKDRFEGPREWTEEDIKQAQQLSTNK